MGPLSNRMSVLIRGDTKVPQHQHCSLEAHIQKKGQARISKKVAVCKSGSETSLETDHAGTMTLDF